jgi:hypothetical protein
LIGALLGLGCGSALADPWVEFSPVVDKSSGNVIGNTVNFGGHQWIVIGAENAGVMPKDEGIPIENALVLLQKKDDSGGLFDGGNGIAFRKSGSGDDYKEYDGTSYAKNPEGEDDWDTPNEYRGSTLQQKMEDISQSFKVLHEKEWNVIAERTLTADDDTSYKITGKVDDQKFWALSENEYYKLSVETGKWRSSAWWLRSPYNDYNAIFGRSDGASYPSGIVSFSLAVRPAFNLTVTLVFGE